MEERPGRAAGRKAMEMPPYSLAEFQVLLLGFG